MTDVSQGVSELLDLVNSQRKTITALEAQVAAADRMADAAQDMSDYGTVLAEQKYHRNLDTSLAAYRAAKGE